MTARPITICPSILSADFRALEREVRAVQEAGADRIHCDVMDGHFVPNITFGPMVVAAVKKCVTIPLDVHLMISNPGDFVKVFCDAGADTLTVHAEACRDLPAVMGAIRDRGVRVGVCVNPDKSLDLFLPHLAQIDQVLIMTVYAGFGGQAFIPATLDKMRRVYDEAVKLGRNIDIQVDGGINDSTARQCAEHGANVFVAGNYVFASQDYRARVEALRTAATEGSGDR
jgi:ribulose-phosphate 3-epimerase